MIYCTTKIFFLFSTFLCSILGCERLESSSDILGHLQFTALTVSEASGSQLTGRAVYKSTNTEKQLYLYHSMTSPSSNGHGRWIINDILGSDTTAFAFIDSWSVMPHLIHAVNDPNKITWSVATNDGWILDSSLHLRCMIPDHADYDVDHTVYLDITGFARELGGFYVQIGSENNSPIFSRIRSNDTPSHYLYSLDGNWLISEEVNSDHAVAFVRDSAPLPSLIQSTDWRFTSNNEWHQFPAAIYSGTKERNVYATLRRMKSLPHLPLNQKHFVLRNEVILPATGLGTGGIQLDITYDVLLESYRLGYRFYDLAREYHNEEIMGQLLHSEIPRNEVFLLSKVWPTHLGFYETQSEVMKSLTALQTSYVDSYLLHWPSCFESIEWMNCQNTVNQNGTWRQSWRALERLYSEGRLLSIGVSNFDINLLNQMDEMSLISPHIVQNYGTLTTLDIDVRIWCSNHQTVYIPYATGRNSHDLPPDLLQRVEDVAADEELTVNGVISRFFLTTGTAIIPRSTNISHLHQNINVIPLKQLTQSEMEYLGWNPGNPRQEL